MWDLYKRVPKSSLVENMQYRVALRRRASGDQEYQRAILTACKHDPLYWMSSFCYVYEPRPRGKRGSHTPMLPFVPWEHQVPAIRQIYDQLGITDIGVEKSRGEGMSWIAVLLAVHAWLFKPLSAIGFVSRTEDAVDSPLDSDSLMWKVDWEIKKLPPWMVPRFNRNATMHSLKNLDNESTIVGYSAVGDVASGGRKTWFLMDELAKFPRGPDRDAMSSTQHVTDCRLIVSTPKGAEGAYYQAMHEPSSMLKVILDWKQNPTRNRGLYRMVDGKPVAVDSSNPLLPEYDPPSQRVIDLFSLLRKKGFKVDGTLRSPWYDRECSRTNATPQNIAQELDRDYGGSMHRFFGNDFQSATDGTTRPPRLTGILSYHPETLEPVFEPSETGTVQLWTPLDTDRCPPFGRYVVGVDVSTGLGGTHTSNSSIVVLNQDIGEQVCQIVSNTIPPGDWCDLAIAVCKWFHNAYLAWESNGPTGAGFTKQFKSRNYPNAYYRTQIWKGVSKKTKELGWHTDDKTKSAMFEDLRRLVLTGHIVFRSRELAKEFGQYVYLNGKIQHVSLESAGDDAVGQAHGDVVIGAGVAVQAMLDRPRAREEEVVQDVPVNCLAARDRDWNAAMEAKKSQDDWDNRDNYELANRALGIAIFSR